MSKRMHVAEWQPTHSLACQVDSCVYFRNCSYCRNWHGVRREKKKPKKTCAGDRNEFVRAHRKDLETFVERVHSLNGNSAMKSFWTAASKFERNLSHQRARRSPQSIKHIRLCYPPAFRARCLSSLCTSVERQNGFNAAPTANTRLRHISTNWHTIDRSACTECWSVKKQEWNVFSFSAFAEWFIFIGFGWRIRQFLTGERRYRTEPKWKRGIVAIAPNGKMICAKIDEFWIGTLETQLRHTPHKYQLEKANWNDLVNKALHIRAYQWVRKKLTEWIDVCAMEREDFR